MWRTVVDAEDDWEHMVELAAHTSAFVCTSKPRNVRRHWFLLPTALWEAQSTTSLGAFHADMSHNVAAAA